MKIHSNTYRILTFLIILFFCAIPPIFTKTSGVMTFAGWSLPARQISYAIFAGLLLYFSADLLNPVKPRIHIYKQIIVSLITFFLLVSLSFIIQKFAAFLGETKSYEVQKPGDFLSFVFCVLNFISSAFYEEVIYRFFIPETLGKIIKGFFQSDNAVRVRNDKEMTHQSDEKTFSLHDKAVWWRIDITDFLCDLVSLILFAFGHLYMGFFSVLNAAFAYVVLRFCFRRTKNVFTGTLAHFAYNLFQLYVNF